MSEIGHNKPPLGNEALVAAIEAKSRELLESMMLASQTDFPQSPLATLIRYAKSITGRVKELEDLQKAAKVPYQEKEKEISLLSSAALSAAAEIKATTLEELLYRLEAAGRAEVRDPEMGLVASLKIDGDYEVVDVTKLPAEYLEPAKGKLRKYMNAKRKADEIPEIPGVVFKDRISVVVS